MIWYGPDPRESDVVSNDRVEERAARNAADGGGTRRVGGVRRYAEDLPTADELGEIA